MNPTQSELATIAASITGPNTPAEKVRVALALWDAAGEALTRRQAAADKASRRESDLLTVLPDVPRDGIVAFSDFLKAIMPAMDSEADRVATWRRYLQSDPSIDEQRAAEIIQRDRESGIAYAHQRALQFMRWRDAQAAISRSDKAKKAAEKRHEKAGKNGTAPKKKNIGKKIARRGRKP